jgi:hypothetical protein
LPSWLNNPAGTFAQHREKMPKPFTTMRLVLITISTDLLINMPSEKGIGRWKVLLGLSL